MINNGIRLLATSAYSIAVCVLAIYALHASLLTLIALLRKSPLPPHQTQVVDNWPEVTVQIPLRNERYVVQRIIRRTVALDYPRDKLHIQVLDDSDDDTTALAENLSRQYRTQGTDIIVIHRTRPAGYKAGALQNAMSEVCGEFIAMFDADFVPDADFLKRTIPILQEHPDVGMAQARWMHLNTTQNAFTRVQSLGLDAHFLIDHPARNASGLLMNFNGAAGVWRKQAILDAGGWSADTLTEDLDLSYRAQLHGWQMMYLPDVSVGEELPPLFVAVKAQQRRWAKGATQCLRKLANPILTSRQITPCQKFFAFLHLSGYFSQMALLITLITSLPLTLLPQATLPNWLDVISLVATLAAAFYYLSSQLLSRAEGKRHRLANLLHYPVLLAMGLSTSLNISLALLDGLRNPGGEFVRTAKYNLGGQHSNTKSYNDVSTPSTYLTELLSLCYTGLVLITAILTGNHQFMYISIAYIAAIGLIGILNRISRRKFFSQQKTG